MSCWGHARMYDRMYDRMFERRGKGSFPVGKVFAQNRGVLRQVLLTFACIRSKVCQAQSLQ
jgi:hypothetical protein